MPDFRDLLDKRVDEVKRPALLPAGSYEGTIQRYEVREVEYQKDQPTPVCTFSIQLTAPGEDVDADELVDEDGERIDLSKRVLRFDQNLTPENLWRFGEFLQSLGLDTTGRSFGELLPETKGSPVLVTVIQRPDKRDQSVIYNNISKMTGTANA